MRPYRSVHAALRRVRVWGIAMRKLGLLLPFVVVFGVIFGSASLLAQPLGTGSSENFKTPVTTAVVPIQGASNQVIEDLAFLSDGSVVVVGSYEGTSIEFNPKGTSTTRTSAGSSDAFVAVYDRNGVLSAIAAIGTVAGNDVFRGVSVDASDNVYIAGTVSTGAINVNPNGGALNFSQTNESAIAIKMTNALLHTWTVRIDGQGAATHFNSIAVNSSGDVGIAGAFSGSGVDINTGAGTQSVSSAGGGDALFISLSSAGVFQWGGKIGGTST
ncbi:MAG: hypothetical protein KDB07_08175, partial [Planctomycetes bacterium]|nr:hypothetical protein [Planctomycetota bacterium]